MSVAPAAFSDHDRCRHCRYFEGRALAIERALPAIAAISSAHGSSRVDDGLCLFHDRHVRSSARCGHYLAS